MTKFKDNSSHLRLHNLEYPFQNILISVGREFVSPGNPILQDLESDLLKCGLAGIRGKRNIESNTRRPSTGRLPYPPFFPKHAGESYAPPYIFIQNEELGLEN